MTVRDHKRLTRALPLLASLGEYRSAWLRGDISAGLAIAAVGLPSAIAYPAIAGLPPATGLYASIAPLVAYAVFGPSRRLVVGPDAGTMTVLAAVIGSVSAFVPEGTDRVLIAGEFAILVGIVCLLARLLRLGMLASFLSRPILTGFFAGISLSILIGQIGRMTGLKIESDGLVPPLLELARRAGDVHLPTVILAASMFATMQVARAMRSPVPGSVIVVIVSVVLSLALNFEAMGIAIVGDIPAGLPALRLPFVPGLPLDRLVLGTGAIFLISFGAGLVTARSFGAQSGENVDANRELTGFGAANIAAGFFSAFPVTASDSRTAVNLSAGGMSQVASIVAAATLVAALLFLGPALRILPVAALGAILASTALGLIDVGALRRLWAISRIEFIFALVAMAGPLSLGILQGIVTAAGASILYILIKSMKPGDALLGRIPGRDGFYKLHRNPAARPVPGLGLVVVQGSLLFYSAEHIQRRVDEFAADMPPDTRWLVIDAGAMTQIDSTGAEALIQIADDLDARGIKLGLAELNSEPRALLEGAGVVARIGREMVFEDLDDALRAFEEMRARTENETREGKR